MLLLVIVALAVLTEKIRSDHVEPLRPHRWVADGRLGDKGVPVHVDALKHLQLVEAAGVVGETVVSEADLLQGSEASKGMREKFDLVDGQAECLELGQQAKL